MLQRKQENMEQARAKAIAYREARAGYLRKSLEHRIRLKPFRADDHVLIFDTVRAKSYSRTDKFEDRWLGPFKIIERFDNGSYRLKELDGTPRHGTYAPDRLRIFYKDELGWWNENKMSGPARVHPDSGTPGPNEETTREVD